MKILITIVKRIVIKTKAVGFFVCIMTSLMITSCKNTSTTEWSGEWRLTHFLIDDSPILSSGTQTKPWNASYLDSYRAYFEVGDQQFHFVDHFRENYFEIMELEIVATDSIRISGKSTFPFEDRYLIKYSKKSRFDNYDGLFINDEILELISENKKLLFYRGSIEASN